MLGEKIEFYGEKLSTNAIAKKNRNNSYNTN